MSTDKQGPPGTPVMSAVGVGNREAAALSLIAWGQESGAGPGDRRTENPARSLRPAKEYQVGRALGDTRLVLPTFYGSGTVLMMGEATVGG
jgi:hypothetical protein